MLAQPRMWKEAAGQALFSVGVGPGCILVYASHIKKDADSNVSFVTVALIDICAALIAGFAMIPTAAALDLDMQSGAGLIFIVITAGLGAIGNNYIFGTRRMLDEYANPGSEINQAGRGVACLPRKPIDTRSRSVGDTGIERGLRPLCIGGYGCPILPLRT